MSVVVDGHLFTDDGQMTGADGAAGHPDLPVLDLKDHTFLVDRDHAAVDATDGPHLLSGDERVCQGLLGFGALALRADDEQPEDNDHEA